MQESRKLLEMAQRHMEKPYERPYKLQEVFSQQSVKAYVQRSYIVLSESEYAKEFGGARKARDPALGSCMVMSPQGQCEKVFLFKDPDQPFRKLVVSSGIEEVKDVEQMNRNTHHHESQAQKTWEGKIQDCLKDWQLKSVLGQGGHFLTTVDEFRAKLKRRQAPDDDSQATPVADGKGRSSHHRHEAEVAGSESDDSDEGGSGEEPASAGEVKEPEAKPASVASEAKASSREGFKRSLAKEFDKAAAAAPAAIGRSGSSASLGAPSRAATKEWDGPDAASVSESAAFLKKPDHQLSEEDLLAKHVQKTPIMAALRGDKALGVQAGFAREATKKLGPTLSAQLKGHLRLFNYALSLSPKELPGLSNAELTEAVTALMPHVDRWPTAVLESVFQRTCRTRVDRALSEMNQSALSEVFDHIKPYKAEDAEQVSVLDTKLQHVSKVFSERATQFADIVIGELCTPVIRQGEKGEARLITLLRCMRESLEEWMLKDDVPAGFEITLKELLDFCQGCVPLFLTDPFLQLPHQPALEKVKASFCTIGIWSLVFAEQLSTRG